MEDVETKFNLALQYINNGGLAAQHPGQSPPSHEVLLEFYALYKQAEFGDCKDQQPWKWQLKRYKKWEAWNSKLGMSKVDAMQQYADRLTLYVPKWRDWKELPPAVTLAQLPTTKFTINDDLITSPAAAFTVKAPLISSMHRFVESPIECDARAIPSPQVPSLVPPPVAPSQDFNPTPSLREVPPASARSAFSSLHLRCSSVAADSSGVAQSSNSCRTPGQRQLPMVCYIASAIGSVICFCAAAIILMSASKFGTTAITSQAEASVESSQHCRLLYGAGEPPKISPFQELPDAAFLLFMSSIFLAAAARSNAVALDALASAETELGKANQERSHTLRILQSAAAARLALISVSKAKGWSFRCGSRVVSIVIDDAPVTKRT
jgi:diazepam-binding inhibitor (GABA receptor modulating acyl-CoA-binding protein)